MISLQFWIIEHDIYLPLIEMYFASPCGLGRKFIRSFEHWEHGFESLPRHGRIFTILSVVLSCEGRKREREKERPVIGRSPVQRVLPKCLNGFIFRSAF